MRKIVILITALLVLSIFSISTASGSENPINVANVYWFSENSTIEPVPGMNNVPLFITIQNSGPMIYNFTSYIYLKGPFSYGYVINGTKEQEKTVISLPELPSDTKFTIMQLVNISPEAVDGIYIEDLFAYGSFAQNYPVENLSTTFLLPLEGNVQFTIGGSYIGENGEVINPVPGLNPVPYTIIVGNDGNQAVTNVTFIFKPSYPFYGPEQKIVVTAMPQYQYIPVTFMVNFSENVNNGYYPQVIYYSYYNVSGSIRFNFTWSNSVSIKEIYSYIGYNGTVINGLGGMNNVPLNVELMNSGTEYASNVTFIYEPKYPFYGNVQKFDIPVMEPFKAINLIFTVNTYNGIKDGIYNQSLYYELNGTENVINFTVQVNGFVNIIVDDAYMSLNSTIVPGPGMKTVPLYVLVSNTGNSVPTNLTFSYQPTYPFYGNAQQLNISALPLYEPIKIPFFVGIYNNVSDGIYKQYLKYSFAGYSGSIPFYVDILGYSTIQVQGSFKNPPYVYTNQTFDEITYSVINSGNSPAFNVTIFANSSLNIINGPMKIAVLPPDMPINITIFYNTPSSPGNYDIYLHVGKLVYSSTIDVIQSPIISVQPNFPTLTPGASEVQVTFLLKNKGPGTIQSMNVHFIYPEVLDLYVSSDNPLGGLYLNNVTVVNFKQGSNFTDPYIVDVASNANPGKYTGELVFIIYENNSLRPIIETSYFNFEISAPFFSTNNNTGVITLSNLTIIILVLIIIVLVALYIRQVRKTKNQ